jgi:hypothetical protein
MRAWVDWTQTPNAHLPNLFQVEKEKALGLPADLAREDWHTWDPMLIAEGLFAAANIFRFVPPISHSLL